MRQRARIILLSVLTEIHATGTVIAIGTSMVVNGLMVVIHAILMVAVVTLRTQNGLMNMKLMSNVWRMEWLPTLFNSLTIVIQLLPRLEPVPLPATSV